MKNLEALYARLREAAPDMPLLRDEPMSRHTTFRVGGPVRLMALPGTEQAAAAALRAAAEHDVQPFYLGNGSNLLVADEGYDGFVVKLAGELERVQGDGPLLRAGSAALLSRVANTALENGLTGLEFASGIPGSVGGAAVMNAGAYGGELKQAVDSVRFMDENGAVREIPAEQCGFGYRQSVFSRGGRLILSVAFRLSKGDRAAIRARMDELNAKRREKQPLEYPSAGSAFKRPAPVDGVPRYAAALIEQCGLKGVSVGGARVSEKHAGFIINTGGATCGDIRALMDLVRERVFRETGVALEPEVKYLG